MLNTIEITINMDPEINDKLEFIAKKENRTLTNQIMAFIAKDVREYFSSNDVAEEYMNYLNNKDKV